MKQSNSPFISVKDLCVTYNKQEVLSNCSFELDKGMSLSVLGKNGCGKSTLLRTLAGLHEDYTGEIIINNQVVASPTTHVPASQRGIGMIFQDYALFPHLTVRENIAFGLKKASDSNIEARINSILDLFKLNPLANRYPHQLSGGQQQRTAIGRSIICKPSILLFDEPFSNLDTQTRYELIIEIKSILAEQNITAIFVTHNKTEAFKLGDKIAFFKEGYIAQYDTPENIYDHPHDLSIADFFGDMIKLTGLKTELGWKTDLGIIQPDQISQLMIQHKSDEQIDIYLRPHQVFLSKEKKANQAAYTIKEKQFNGDTSNYLVQMENQAIWVQSHYRLETKDKLFIGLKLED